MIQKTLYEEALMRNPFTDEFKMERQELLNYIFEGRRTKFGKIKLNSDDLYPHILKHYMESLIEAADDLIVDAGCFHNLMNMITHKFIRLLPDLFRYYPIRFSDLDEDTQTFIIKIVRNELSFKEIVKKLAKNNYIVRTILRNKSITKEIIQKIGNNKRSEIFLNAELNDVLKAKLLLNCFDIEKSEKEQIKICNPLDYDLDKSQRLISDVAYFETNSKDKDKQFFDDLRKLLILEYFNIDFKIRTEIPVELHETIEETMKLMFSLIADDLSYSYKFPDMIIKNANYAPLKPIPENQIIFRKHCLLFNDVDFDNFQHTEIINNLLQRTLKGYEYVGFKKCLFNSPILINNKDNVDCKVFFDDCIFNSVYHVETGKDRLLNYFNNCIIYGNFIFGKSKLNSHLPCNIEFYNSVFMPHASLEISDITESYPKQRFIQIDNTVFNGHLKMANISKEADIRFIMRNFAINSPFVIENCYFNKESLIDNLSFAKSNTQTMKDSINNLTRWLQISGLNKTAFDDGLLKDETTKEMITEADKDINAYKIACESGFLKPKYAAFYLSMSKDNLAKKRMADKQRVTRETIPYIGEGKSILYPLDALKAYKIKDWDTLKKLREKYSKNESNSADSE